MAVIVGYELSICTDCAQLSANGTHGHCVDCCEDGIVCEERMRTIKGISRIWGNNRLVVTGEEFSFSHRTCDGCGSILAGDRIDAVAMA